MFNFNSNLFMYFTCNSYFNLIKSFRYIKRVREFVCVYVSFKAIVSIVKSLL